MRSAWPRRGEIYTCDLRAAGGPLFKNRPVLILQNDAGNEFSSEIIVAAIRHARPRRPLPIQVLVPAGTGGLTKDSVVDCGHIATVERTALGRRWGELPPEVLAHVGAALRVSLGL